MAAEHQLTAILERMEVPDERGIFVLGCLERRVTLYSQQVRALNLVHALFETGRLGEGSRLAVIGAGPAGLTMAAGAARRGARVTLLERQLHLEFIFQGNTTRGLHPHIYDWPAKGWREADAGLPLLNWRAGPAGHVAQQILREWERLASAHKIAVHLGVEDVNLSRSVNITLSWNERNPHATSERAHASEQFDAAVFAVGFGRETQHPAQGLHSYWENDSLNQLVGAPKKQEVRILISGTGDGGLVDLLRAQLQDFEHDRIIEEFLDDGELPLLEKQLLALESDRTVPDEVLYERYRMLNVPRTFDERIKARVRPGVLVVLNGEATFPFTRSASLLNRFLASRLLVQRVPYKSGRITVMPSNVGGYTVQFTRGPPEAFDRVVLRHGPVPAALKEGFPHLWAKLQARKQHLPSTDPSLSPQWKEDSFECRPISVSGEHAPLGMRRRASLPAPRHVFGRTLEVERLVSVLLAPRPSPLFVHGPPGIGKSTLTLQALHDARVATHYGSQRYFIRLDGASSVDAMSARIAEALGLRPDPDASNQVESFLETTPALLILDNAETPWDADRMAVEAFLQRLAALPTLALVASLRGNELPLLHRSTESMEVLPLESSEARELFYSIAHNVPRDHPLLSELLEAQQSVPLAVVLLASAAQGTDLTLVHEIWRSERTAMLARGKDRESNLAVSIELSLASPRMNDEAAHDALFTLAQLPEGISEADREEALPRSAHALLQLQKSSLVYLERHRWRILAPIREHTLRHHPPRQQHRERLLDFYFDQARKLGPLVGHAKGGSALESLAGEFSNIEALLVAELRGTEPMRALDTLVKLSNFLRFSGYGSLRLVEEACEVARRQEDTKRLAASLKLAGEVALRRSEHGRARAIYEEALPLFEQQGDFYGQAHCIRGLGSIALDQGHLDDAQEKFKQAFALYGRIDSTRSQGNCLHGLGKVAFARGDLEEARLHCEEAIRVFDQVQHTLGRAYCYRTFGDIARRTPSLDEAWTYYIQAREIFQTVGELRNAGHCMRSLADVDLARGSLETAQRQYEEASVILKQVGSLRGVANCNRGLGDVAYRQARTREAREFYRLAIIGFEKVEDTASASECRRWLAELSE